MSLLSLASPPRRAVAQQHPYVPAVAPKDTSTFWIFNDATAGPYFTAGYSRQNEAVPEGWHSASRFVYIFGATSDFSISPWFGFDLGLLYDTRDLYLATIGGDTASADVNIGYIAIQPAIRIAWLLLGLAFDIPVSGSADESISQFSHLELTGPYHQNLNVGSSDMNTLVELRAVLTVPVYQAESGTVRLIASANWPLTKHILQATSFDTTGHFQNIGRGPLPAFEVGLSYQFDLLH
jgi:hypothetical protein